MKPGLTRDAFLGGRVHVWQPKEGFRAGIDAVLLAAALPVAKGQSALELGCGVGTASLCLNARVQELKLVGIELQPDYAELAKRNANDAGAGLEVHQADLARLPADVRARNFDCVFANPPYFLPLTGTGANDLGRETALRGETKLADWVDVAIKRTRPGGVIVFIQRAQRTQELLSAMDDRVGAIELLPLAARAGKSAGLVIVRARKGRRLTANVQKKIANALNAAVKGKEGEREILVGDIFNYGG